MPQHKKCATRYEVGSHRLEETEARDLERRKGQRRGKTAEVNQARQGKERHLTHEAPKARVHDGHQGSDQ